MAKSVLAKKLVAHTDSQLVEAQFSGVFTAKGSSMIKYLEQVKLLAPSFEHFELKKVPRDQNERADALARLASASGAIDTRSVVLMTSRRPLISNKREGARVLAIDQGPS